MLDPIEMQFPFKTAQNKSSKFENRMVILLWALFLEFILNPFST